MLHKLYNLDAVAREGYKTFNFPKGTCFVHYSKPNTNVRKTVVIELSNFANITLSSLYHDITKDRLYCHPADSLERRVIVATMQHVNCPLSTLVSSM